MLIRCWGSRGSVPVCGEQFLKYGGDTTCIEIRTDSHVVVVDAGTGIRPLGEQLFNEGIKNIHLIFTHAHWDHIIGFPFFYPLYRSDTRLSIRGYPFNRQPFRNAFDTLMSEPFFPVHFGGPDIRAAIDFEDIDMRPFDLGDLHVRPIFLSHPKNGSVGYRFEHAGRSFVFLTDNELGLAHPGACSYDDYVSFCEGADLLIHDAEYTDEEYKLYRGWGHSRFSDVVKLAHTAQVKSLGLFHINQKRSDHDVDAMVETACDLQQKIGGDIPCRAINAGYFANL